MAENKGAVVCMRKSDRLVQRAGRQEEFWVDSVPRIRDDRQTDK